ncbi:hypothetical protein [Porcipelethomonas sp.]|uniref:hypothetical protein n=1 Tax=Porcipelethomonas sp. TaxID=2981675 RepID=UPI003EF3EED9
MTYTDIPEVKLSDYIPEDKFRTILSDQRKLPKGATEISVRMDFRKNSYVVDSGCLAECFRGNVSVHGLVTPGEKLTNELSEKNIKRSDVEIALNEWDKERFMLIFRQSDGTEEPIYFVKTQDIISLLTNCLNPNL